MESRAKAFGHPIHQSLVAFPIGAFGVSIALDALHSRTGRYEHAEGARQALNFGLVTATLVAPFGLVDWIEIDPGTRAKRVGLIHAIGNLAVLGLFATSRLLRAGGCAPSSAKWVSGAAFTLSGVTAWLGGELVTRHAIGVHNNPDQDSGSTSTEQT